MKKFIFGVESIGLHGEGFAVAGGVYSEHGSCLREFAYHCNPDEADGNSVDREWVENNVTICKSSILLPNPDHVRTHFWREWIAAKEEGALMFVECGWPVEAAFLEACVRRNRALYNWLGPYPMHEIASVMLVAGMNPMATYERLPHELPAHEPLADSRLSARLLHQALTSILTSKELLASIA